MLASSGFIAQVDESKCVACNTCATYCQFGALGLEGGLNHVDEELCMGCGVCVSKCSEGAITLHLEPTKGKPLEIFNLIEEGREVPVLG